MACKLKASKSCTCVKFKNVNKDVLMGHLSSGCGAGVGKEAVVTVDAESAESSGVGWGVSDGVEHLLNRWKKD